MINLKCVKPLTSAVLAATVAAGVFLWASNASAEPGFYVGGAYGMGRVNNSDFDDDNSAIKVFLGGKMNRYIGVEGALNDYGKAESRGFSSDLTGNSLALIGFLPVTDSLELYLVGPEIFIWSYKNR